MSEDQFKFFEKSRLILPGPPVLFSQPLSWPVSGKKCAKVNISLPVWPGSDIVSHPSSNSLSVLAIVYDIRKWLLSPTILTQGKWTQSGWFSYPGQGPYIGF